MWTYQGLIQSILDSWADEPTAGRTDEQTQTICDMGCNFIELDKVRSNLFELTINGNSKDYVCMYFKAQLIQLSSIFFCILCWLLRYFLKQKKDYLC